MKEILRTLGQPDGAWTATPIGLILRFGEGLDALKNLARSAETGLTMDEKAASLVCGTAQLGGLLFAIVASTFALFACSCIPVFASLAICFTRIGAATGKRRPRLPPGYAAVDT